MLVGELGGLLGCWVLRPPGWSDWKLGSGWGE